MTAYDKAMSVIDNEIITPSRNSEDILVDLHTIKEELDIRIESMGADS